jgi:CrcB protein
MLIYLCIGLGGFAGALTRYFLARWIATTWGVTFPYGTLLINLSGSFLLCFLSVLLSTHALWSPALRLASTVGFLGAYTTFSTFSYEWLWLWQNGQVGPSLIYILGSVVGGGIAGILGLCLGRLLS